MIQSNLPPRPNTDARSERLRESPGRLLSSCFHLVRACLLHDDTNQSVQSLVGPVEQALEDCCAKFSTDSVRVLFTHDMVFMHRKLLRASREIYQVAQHMGVMLDRCGANEVHFDRGASRSSLLNFARFLAESQRNPSAATALRSALANGVSVGHAPPTDLDPAHTGDESPAASVAKSVAVSVLLTRSFFARLAWGDMRGAHDLLHTSRRLVALHDTHPALCVAVAAAPCFDEDPAKMAVSAAILAVAMARILTDDRVTLASIALNALLADSGRTRLDASSSEDRCASATLLASTELGRFHPATILRGAIAYESLAMSDPDLPLPGSGTTPSLPASILRIARAFVALRADPGPSPRLDQALRSLAASFPGQSGAACVRLLHAAMGILPPGKAVLLNTGEVAIVRALPVRLMDFSRPPVRILTDDHRQLLPVAIDLDLAASPTTGPPRMIRRALAASL